MPRGAAVGDMAWGVPSLTAGVQGATFPEGHLASKESAEGGSGLNSKWPRHPGGSGPTAGTNPRPFGQDSAIRFQILLHG